MKFLGYWNKSVAFTYLSVIAAVIGMVFVNKGKMSLALLALIISGVADSFDGTIARRCKRDEHACNYGIQIDSLADSVAFLALPAYFLIVISNSHPVSAAIAAFYVLCGVVRLAWFNVTVEDNPGIFRGVPVTQIAVTLPLVYVLAQLFAPGVLLVPVLDAVFALVAVLFVTDIRIPKPRGIWLLGIVFLFVLSALGLMFVH